MTSFLADRQPWTSDAIGVVIHSVTAAAFVLAWVCVPA
jgi:hypothetical protein